LSEKPSSASVHSQIQKGIESLKIAGEGSEKGPPVKARKKIDVVAEYEKSKSKRKENANLVVIGVSA